MKGVIKPLQRIGNCIHLQCGVSRQNTDPEDGLLGTTETLNTLKTFITLNVCSYLQEI